MAPGYALLVGGGLLAVVASGVVAGIVVDDVRSMTPTYVVIGAIATWLTAIAVYGLRNPQRTAGRDPVASGGGERRGLCSPAGVRRDTDQCYTIW